MMEGLTILLVYLMFFTAPFVVLSVIAYIAKRLFPATYARFERKLCGEGAEWPEW